MDFLMESLLTECHMDPLMHHPLTPLIMLHHMQILIVYPKDILTHPLMDIPMDLLTHPPMGLPLHMDHLMDILIPMLPLKDITIELHMDILLILMHPLMYHFTVLLPLLQSLMSPLLPQLMGPLLQLRMGPLHRPKPRPHQPHKEPRPLLCSLSNQMVIIKLVNSLPVM